MAPSIGGKKVIRFWSGKYAPESFIIPGQDQNGNSMREYCRVVPLLDRAIDVLVGSKKFPFKSKGDLMRWCLKVGVDSLNEMEPMLGSVTAQVDAIHSILRDEMLNNEFMTVFNSMANTIGMHIQAQELGEARRLVSMIKSKVESMDSGYWRKRYLGEMEKRFGYLLHGDKVAGAGMGEMEDRVEKFEEPDEEE